LKDIGIYKPIKSEAYRVTAGNSVSQAVPLQHFHKTDNLSSLSTNVVVPTLYENTKKERLKASLLIQNSTSKFVSML
jgi:hypothetical protein